MGNRSIRRIHKDAADKALLALARKRDHLRTLRWVQPEPLVPVDKPYLWGWGRELVLREDVARRRDAARFHELLSVVQHRDESRRKDFKVWDYKKRRLVESKHRPSRVGPRRWARLPDYLRRLFYRSWDEYGHCHRIEDPWMFESRRYRIWITHRRIPDTELQQELSYVEARFEQAGGWGRYHKLKSPRRNGWKARNVLSRETKRKQAERRALREELEEAMQLLAAGQLHALRGREVMEDAEA